MKYHPYGNIDPFLIPETADKLLNEYWTIAARLKIRTFLHLGTCLGFVRDGGWIYADNDIDVGILNGKEKLEAALIKNGFEKKWTCRTNTHFLKYEILFDLYFEFPDWRFFKTFDKVIYKKRMYNVPHPVKEFLEASFGSWKIEKHRTLWKRK